MRRVIRSGLASWCLVLAAFLLGAQGGHLGAAAQRPPVAGRNAAVSAGHPLTTAAALEVLLKGGNAFDAGVAAMLVGGVVEQDLYGLGGEALVLVYPQRERKVTSIAGQGWAPKGATIDWYVQHGKSLDGEGLDPAVVPGALHAILTVLDRWGTLSFEQVSARAIEHARDGFPLRPRTAAAIVRTEKFIRAWPDNARFWLKPDGSFYAAGETMTMPSLARTLTRMVGAERKARRRGRSAGIAAARDLFYKGAIAQEMTAFLQKHGAPFEVSDFSDYYARVEEPTSTTYRGYTVYKQSFNSQGPSLLQTLNILEQFDLEAMGHNSADYLHTLVEAMKLTYADRDTYYADPEFVRVPAAGLLSKEYARARAGQIDKTRASTELVAGDPLAFDPAVREWPYWIAGKQPEAPRPPDPHAPDLSMKDTTHIAIIDRHGNVFDVTPSGGWVDGAVILGETGIGLSTRGEQFWLDKTKAAQLRPRSRPRYTLTPSIVLKDGEPFMAIGTPGGDNQEQTILQVFLNVVEFWDAWYPNLHAATERPRVQTQHFIASFWPHPAGLNKMSAEEGIPLEVVDELKARGHDVAVVRPFSISGCGTVVVLDPKTGNRIAGADPRRDCYAMAY